MRHRIGNRRGFPNIIIYSLFNKGVHEAERGEICPKKTIHVLYGWPPPQESHLQVQFKVRLTGFNRIDSKRKSTPCQLSGQFKVEKLTISILLWLLFSDIGVSSKIKNEIRYLIICYLNSRTFGKPPPFPLLRG